MGQVDITDMELVEALCEIEKGLTEWEVEFVESLAKQKALPRPASFRWHMSVKQRAVAERIWTEKGS